MRKIIILTSLLITIVSTSVLAGIRPGPYVGLDIGYGRTKSNLGSGSSSKTHSVSGVGGGFNIGSKFSDYGAFEFGYTHWSNGNSDINPSNGSTVIHNDSINIAGKGLYSILSLNVFGKLGVGVLRSSGGGSAITVRNTKIQTSVKPLVGFGISYDMSQTSLVSLSYTQLFVNNKLVQNTSLLALTFETHFVDVFCGQFLC